MVKEGFHKTRLRKWASYILSDAAEQKVESFRSEGERVCCVRFVAWVVMQRIQYIFLTVAPCQNSTIQDLQAVLKKASFSTRLYCYHGRHE